MRPEALEFLACPVSGDPLVLEGIESEDPDGHVITARLRAVPGGATYPIREGVPRLLAPGIAAVRVATARRFAEEWRRWHQLRDCYERQLFDWIAPVAPGDLAGRTVFEGGCGKGRHTAIVARCGARAVVSLDLGESAIVAFRNTRHLPQAHVVIGDLMHPPVKPCFDLALAIGVLHHMPDPAAAFRALAATLQPGGRVAIWVYGREGNEWIRRWVDPVRRAFTSRLPAPALWWLTLPVAALVHLGVRLTPRPQPGGSAPRGPYAEYLAGLRGFPFGEVHAIVFDHLVTPVAHYLEGPEVARWFDSGFREVTVRRHRRYSWAATALKS